MNYKELRLHHAVFQQISPSLYYVEKDVFSHFSIGSKISSQMLNCYLSIVPSSARIHIENVKCYGEE